MKHTENGFFELTICDPACGSGAFLNQALEFLITEHHYIYELELKLIGTALIDVNLENRILEKNIFGVDINEESVEIAKLSLWLRTAQHGRTLTTLNDNIKCGNSLIEDKKIDAEKAFEWKKEFAHIFKKGGFDVVIGNPPYVPTEYISEINRNHFVEKYSSAFGRINLYVIFYEKGINLLKERGLLGFITPYTILKNKYYFECRKFILQNTSLVEIVDFKGITVFKDAAVDSIIMIIKNSIDIQNNYNQVFNIKDLADNSFQTIKINQNKILLERSDLSLVHNLSNELIKRLSNDSVKVEDVINFKQGIITGDNKRFVTYKKSELSKKVITGSNFNRYTIEKSNQYVTYDKAILHRSRNEEIFEVKEKILLRQTASYPICAIDIKQHYTLDTVHNGIIRDTNFSIYYVLTLLNSRLMKFLYESSINETGKVFAQVKIMYINPLPIKKTSKENQQPFIDLANKMISLNEEFSAKKDLFLRRLQERFAFKKTTRKLDNFYTDRFNEVVKELEKQKIVITLREQDEWQDYFEEIKERVLDIQSQIQIVDSQIDNLVFELYKLTEEEIELIKND